MTTWKPAAAIPLHNSKPMPELPPVTIQILFLTLLPGGAELLKLCHEMLINSPLHFRLRKLGIENEFLFVSWSDE